MIHKKVIVIIIQLLLVISFFVIWEYFASKNIINSFIFSSPSRILKCILNFPKTELINHILITLKEIFISFTLSIIIGFIFALLLYEVPILFKILEPFLTILNSAPKVALGPLMIIMFGAKDTSIIIMALSITLVINILSIHSGFCKSDSSLAKLLTSLNASKYDQFVHLTLPSAYQTIISSLKINISMTLIGVIMGEFLVSKAGIGYLIIYGTQVFNLTLVMSGIVILIIISYVLYLIISVVEKLVNKKISNES